MPARRILIIDNTHPFLRRELKEMGFACDEFPGYTRPDFEKIIHEYYGIIIRSKIKLDESILSKAVKLHFIGRVGAGMESIDVEYAVSHGITCLNSPEGNRDAVGEHTIGMLLSLLNHLNRADMQVRLGKWNREENRGIEIKGKTIGIIGYGNTGDAFARKLGGFEAIVLAFDKYKTGYSGQFVTESNMDKLFAECDILSLHVPLTEETFSLVNADYLDRFRKPIWIINTSRGQVVNTADLVDALRSGKLRGAALDVLEYEKTSFEKMRADTVPEPLKYLCSADNVILSPHIAGWTVESLYKLAKVLADKIRNLPE